MFDSCYSAVSPVVRWGCYQMFACHQCPSIRSPTSPICQYITTPQPGAAWYANSAHPHVICPTCPPRLWISQKGIWNLWTHTWCWSWRWSRWWCRWQIGRRCRVPILFRPRDRQAWQPLSGGMINPIIWESCPDHQFHIKLWESPYWMEIYIFGPTPGWPCGHGLIRIHWALTRVGGWRGGAPLFITIRGLRFPAERRRAPRSAGGRCANTDTWARIKC